MEPTSSRFDTLEQTLEAFQENARQLSIIAQDFQPKSQEPMMVKLQSLISFMQELDRTKQSFQDVKVPLEVLEYLDKGTNPQLYSKEILDRTVERNKEVNGRIELYKKFRANLLKELVDEMPKDTNLYRTCRDNVANNNKQEAAAAAAGAAESGGVASEGAQHSATAAPSTGSAGSASFDLPPNLEPQATPGAIPGEPNSSSSSTTSSGNNFLPSSTSSSSVPPVIHHLAAIGGGSGSSTAIVPDVANVKME